MQLEALAVFPLFAISCVILRLMLGSWLTPPAFSALYWTFFIFLNIFYPEYQMLVPGLLYMLGATLMFSTAHFIARAVFFNSDLAPMRRQWAMKPIPSRYFRYGLLLQICMGLAYVLALQRGAVVAVDNISWWVQILLISHFTGPLVVGLLLGAEALQGKDRFLAFGVLTPALAVSILYTGRTALFGPCVIFVTAYLAATVCVHPVSTPLFSWRRVMLVGIALVVSTAYGTAIYVLRTARGETDFASLYEKVSVFATSFDRESWSSSYDKMRSHVYGQPSSFTFIYRDHYSQPSFQPMLGKFFFAGPLVLIGVERPAHENFMTVDGVETNVYTIYAPAIEDFGIYGSIVWWGVVGIVSGVAYRWAQKGRLAGAAIVAIILMNLQIGSCFLFRYNSVIASYLVLFGGALYLDKRNRALVPPVSFPSRTRPRRGRLAPPLGRPS